MVFSIPARKPGLGGFRFDAMSQRVAPSLGCGYFFVVILAGAGCASLFASIRRYQSSGDAISGGVVVPALVGGILLLAAVAYALFAHRKVREFAEDERLRVAHPDEPWLWRREWRGAHIEAEEGKNLVVIWLLAAIWNGLSLPGVVHFIQHPPRDKAAYLIFLFPLVGIGLLATAGYQTLRRAKYGRIRFLPTSLPGVIGGHLGGVIVVPSRIFSNGEVRLVLGCIKQVVRGSGKSRQMVETVLWEADDSVPTEKLSSGYGRTEVPVLFAIPPGYPATALDNHSDRTIWRLTATAETPGIDFSARFHPPVFSVPGLAQAEVRSAGTDTEPSGSRTAEKLTDEALRTAGIERQLDGWSFTARPLRRFKWTAIVIQLGTTALLVTFAAHSAPLPAWVMVAPFGLVAFLFSYDLLKPPSRLQLFGQELIITDHPRFRRRRRRVSRGDVADVRAGRSLEVGAKKYHRLILVGPPVGDPPVPCHPEEPFTTRKLRRQLDRATASEAPALRARLAAAPRWEITVASHVPGPVVLESLRAEILARLAESRD